jgi:bacterioferritin
VSGEKVLMTLLLLALSVSLRGYEAARAAGRETPARDLPAAGQESDTSTTGKEWTVARTKTASDILSDDSATKRDAIVKLLTKAYWMEMETVMSYVANSINPDGVRAQEVVEALGQDVQAELGHAQAYAQRIKELYGVVPGSMDFKAEQTYLQPPAKQTDIVHVIKGVIEAERGAIEHYNRVIEETDGVDWATQDMVIEILRDEQGHLRLFEGFLREFEAEGRA